MGMKQYIGFGLIFIVAVGVYVFSFIEGRYALSISGINISLPIALWIVLPALILFLATVAHLMFHGAKNFVKLRSVKKDGEKFTEAAKGALLGKDIATEYKTDIFKLPGEILPFLNTDRAKAEKPRAYHDDIQDIIDAKRKIATGEVVDLSKFKLHSDNSLVLKNAKNRLKEDRTYATEILKRCDDKILCEEAFKEFSLYASKNDMEKYQKEPTREILNIMLSRINAEKDPIDLDDEEIIEYVKDLGFTKDDFIDLVKRMKSRVNPDRMILFVEKLAHSYPLRANEAYLYIMFELQMMDKAREILVHSNEDEYLIYKYMLFLKDHGQNFDTDIFI